MTTFVSELKRRNVLRVAATYALIAWILIEAGSVLLPTFGAPDGFFRGYVMIVVAGFAVSLLIAWVFEVTPDGVKLERNLDRDSYKPDPGGSSNSLIIGLLAIALAISITFNITGMRGDALDLGSSTTYNSVAVLPFTSRSLVEENQFFADGIHDDILTRLAEIKSLRVISQASVNNYRDASRNLLQIGEELGVSTIVEGAVQRSGDAVRITVQLVDIASDKQIWGKSYDRKLSIESVFEVQTEISAQIATSLRAALTPAQETRMAAMPTDNIEAYVQYVAGRENLLRRTFTSLNTARAQFENAVRLDPDYAQAHSALADTVLILVSNHQSIPRKEAYAIAAEHTKEALRIDPMLAQAYATRGLLKTMQWEATRLGSGNVEAAAAFEKAIALNPNLADAHVWFGSLRQSEGEIEAAIDLLSIALAIDPLSRIPYVNLPSFLASEGQNKRTIELLLHAVKIFPDWATPYQYLSTHLQGLGRLDEAVAWGLSGKDLSDDPVAGGNLLGIYQEFGDDQSIADFMAAFPTDHALYDVGTSFSQLLQKDYDGAVTSLDRFQKETAFPVPFVHSLLEYATVLAEDYDRAYEVLTSGNSVLARDAAETVDRFNLDAAVLLAFVEQKRNNHRTAALLLDQAEIVVRELPRLGMAGHGIKDVHILTLQGRSNAAIEALTQAVNEGFASSQPFDGWSFDEDPIIEPLRSDPRFDVLRQRIYERVEQMRQNVETARQSGDWSPLLAKADLVEQVI